MNAKAVSVLLAVLLVGALVVGCTSGTTGYSTYGQQQQQPYVGGGCGVAPSAGYEDAPVQALKPSDSAL